MKLSLPLMIGLAGVAHDENEQARKLGRFFEWPMILIAFAIVVEWYSKEQGHPLKSGSLVSDWMLWGFFIMETLVLSWAVDDRKRYLLTNWANLMIIASGVLLFFDEPSIGGLRALRLLAIVVVLLNMSGEIRQLLTRNQLGTTLLICMVIMMVAGTLMSLIDPNIDSPIDGIWWAWVTATTVGYGDIVPSTGAGRIFASLLILMGIGLLSMLTASISALLIHKDEKEQARQISHQVKQMAEMEQRMARVEEKLDQLLALQGQLPDPGKKDRHKGG